VSGVGAVAFLAAAFFAGARRVVAFLAGALAGASTLFVTALLAVAAALTLGRSEESLETTYALS
jgi:hypothetical protein